MGTLKKRAFAVVWGKKLKMSLESNTKGTPKKITLIILLNECQEFLKSNQTKPCIPIEPKRLVFNIMSLMDGSTSQSPLSESLNLSAEISKCLFWRTQFLFDLRMSSFYEAFYGSH